MNKMRDVKIEKLTLNIGAGKDQKVLDKGIKLLNHITGITPIKTITQKRIASWGLRPGLPIGCKLTLRGKEAAELWNRLLTAKDKLLKETNFDNHGNVSFGVTEYIDVPGVKYEPEIGVMGFQASLTLERSGFRIKRRKIQKKKIHHNHQITKKDAISFMKEKFQIQVGETQ